jgi:hypothetical protein
MRRVTIIWSPVLTTREMIQLDLIKSGGISTVADLGF